MYLSERRGEVNLAVISQTDLIGDEELAFRVSNL
jgi:hypothetical protein